MPPKANARAQDPDAAENSVLCAAKHNAEFNSSSNENQAVRVVRVVGAILENYVDRQIALRQIGRAQ